MPLTIIREDITRMAVDAIVNATNKDLQMGGGVCGAIFKAAGAEALQAACNKVSPIQMGKAAITPGFSLPAKYVIHAAGPVYRRWDKEKSRALLCSAYQESLRLAEEISRESVKHQVDTDILIEVNVAGEESKFGVSVEEAPQLVEEISRMPAVHVRGLMTIAPFVENAEENRQYFRKLKQLSVDIERKNIDNVNMTALSMGMTGDYSVAIEEGATCVRVGTGIFGERGPWH